MFSVLRRCGPVLMGISVVAFFAFLHPLHSSAATITVTTTGDTVAIDALASLREAITSINNQADVSGDVTLNRVGNYATLIGGTPDVINFNILGAGVKTISVTGSALPTITQPVTLNGYTQGAASANTLANGDNAVLLIQLDGTAPVRREWLDINTATGTTLIQGVVIGKFTGEGVSVTNGTAAITGNFIGTNPAGIATVANTGGGIVIGGGIGSRIGGTAPDARNLISGNGGHGVDIEGGTDIVIEGNFIGTDHTGTFVVSNTGNGILVAAGNPTVGGTLAGARNVIGGNGGNGIAVTGSNTIIRGNFLGVGADGVTHVTNASAGIAVSNGATSNQIGGTVAGAGNLIEFNTGVGIKIGNSPADTATVDNSVLGNSIYSNGGATGIDLASDGITANGANLRSFPNDGQNYPVLTAASDSGIFGTLDSTATTTFRIEVFVSPSGAIGGRNGQTFIGFFNVTTNSSGHAALNFTAPGTLPIGSVITATATNPLNDTSEFSAPQTIVPAVPNPLPPSKSSSVTFVGTTALPVARPLASGSGTPNALPPRRP